MSPLELTLAAQKKKEMDAAGQSAQGPTQTVAEKLLGAPPPPMGGIGAPSPMPQQGAPAGLGATPEAAQMQAPMPEMPAPEMSQGEAPVGMKGGGKVHGRFNASDKGSNYGADISLDDLTSFSLEGSGRRVFDPDVIRAALRHRKGDTEISAEHTLRGGTDYGIEKPFLGGRLGIHAGASRGFIPDSVRASYNRSFAEGGLTTLPLPDTMFDEPNNGGYADGGIIAFAGGGYGSYFEDVATKAIPGLGVTSRQRTAAQNTAAKGVSNSFHLTDDARDFVPPKGMSMAAFHAKLKGEFGSQYDVINEGDHVHVEPGPGLAKSGQGLLNPAQAANPRTPTDVPGGSITDQMMPAFERAGEFYDKFMPKPKTEARDKMKAYVEEGMSEESQKKEKNYDKWSALADMGWSIAGSNSPNFLQAVAEGGKVAAASGKKSKEAREARFEKYLSQYAEIEGIENTEARERVKFMLDFGKTELDLKDKDLTRGLSWATNKMQDATQNRQITTQDATQRRGQDFSLQASLAGNAARDAQLAKGNLQLAYKQAGDDVKANMDWINGTPAERKKIFQDAVAANLEVLQNSGGGGGSGGGMPWDQNYGG